MSFWFVVFVASIAAAAPSAPLKDKAAKLGLPSGKTIVVELALTPREQEIGLMFRTSLPKDFGMLFVFPYQRPLQFWMKNTWIDLDMVFIGRDKRITSISRKVPRSYPETQESAVARRAGYGQFVLELPAGASDRYGLRPGDRLRFESPKIKPAGIDKE